MGPHFSKDPSINMIPQSYQSHLQSQFNLAENLLLTCLIQLLQLTKTLSLENWPRHSRFLFYSVANKRRSNGF